eukprot:Filipodium_phascolosomae@DN3501_c0_g1_i1.p1
MFALSKKSFFTPKFCRAFSTKKCLTLDSIPQNIIKFEYAVRGAIVARSWELEKRMAQDPSSVPFKDLVRANIGNPQAVGQMPLTFHRQVLAGLLFPETARGFPKDVQDRVAEWKQAMGAYSHSKGIEKFRQQVANWMNERDGAQTDPEDLFLTNGASDGVKAALELLIHGEKDGILVPVPQYPLYSASIARLGGTMIPYYMVEEKGWAMDIKHVKEQCEAFKAKGGRVKGMCIINPGNPTGSVFSKSDLQDVLSFCENEGIVLMADEVYQENIYADVPFYPMRKLAIENNSPVELFSYHSASKGVPGECGLRGGLMHCHNIDPAVMDQIYKLFSVSLCSNTVGQALMANIVSPPKPGDASYDLFKEEHSNIFNALKRKAILAEESFNKMPGVSCQKVNGAMYAFPKLELPEGVVNEAKKRGVAPDFLYCMEALEATGLMAVPGSGFDQRPGTHHFRMSTLPPEKTLVELFERLGDFHQKFLKKY